MDVLGDGISESLLIEASVSDLRVVQAARVSYLNDSDSYNDAKDPKLIHYLIENEHGSPFEHNHLTFRLKAPLFVVQEMLRHRAGVSFNQQSGRYTAFVGEFYVPQVFRQQHPKNKQSSEGELEEQEAARAAYLDACLYAFGAYETLLNLGVPREQARGVLPHCTYTNLYVTFNLRSLMHFLHLRTDKGAQWEIQQYAHSFYDYVKDLLPQTMAAWTEHEEKVTWSKRLFKKDLEVYEVIEMLEKLGYDTTNWIKEGDS